MSDTDHFSSLNWRLNCSTVRLGRKSFRKVGDNGSVWESGVMMNDLGQSPPTPHQPTVMQMSQTMCIKIWHWVTLGNVSFIANLSVAITEEGNKKKWHKIAYLKNSLCYTKVFYFSNMYKSRNGRFTHSKQFLYLAKSGNTHYLTSF